MRTLLKQSYFLLRASHFACNSDTCSSLLCSLAPVRCLRCTLQPHRRHSDEPSFVYAPQSAQVGRLWTSLADFYIRQGMYERARDVYEEGLTTVITVRDFSLIFDTLTQFEETLLTHRMQARTLHYSRILYNVSVGRT